MTLDELLTLPKLIAWLKTKPPETAYRYVDGETCVLTQFARENGFPDARDIGYYMKASGDRVDIPDLISEIAFTEPHNYGAALDRAQKQQPSKLSPPVNVIDFTAGYQHHRR
jgi:hypothetical protein